MTSVTLEGRSTTKCRHFTCTNVITVGLVFAHPSAVHQFSVFDLIQIIDQLVTPPFKPNTLFHKGCCKQYCLSVYKQFQRFHLGGSCYPMLIIEI